MSRFQNDEMKRNNLQHEIEKIHGRQKDTTSEEATERNRKAFPHLFDKEWKEAHSRAIDDARKGTHPMKGDESENFKSGYKQGLTQAHNLRVSIKEHELPHWAKG